MKVEEEVKVNSTVSISSKPEVGEHEASSAVSGSEVVVAQQRRGFPQSPQSDTDSDSETSLIVAAPERPAVVELLLGLFIGAIWAWLWTRVVITKHWKGMINFVLE